MHPVLPTVEKQVAHCVPGDLIGIGWRMDGLGPDASLRLAVQAARAKTESGWGSPAAHNIERFGEQAQIGDFLYMRDTHGRYLLWCLTGAYRCDGSDLTKAVDVHQVREVEWAPKPLNDLEVPCAVVRAFTGVGMSFSRIHNLGARQLAS